MKETKELVGKWVRNAFGLNPSPYASCQGGMRAYLLVKGNPSDPRNPFQWDKIVVNLPATKTYDPRRPRLDKIRADGLPASDYVMYVDDNRAIASTEVLAWEASSRIGKELSFLGNFLI